MPVHHVCDEAESADTYVRSDTHEMFCRSAGMAVPPEKVSMLTHLCRQHRRLRRCCIAAQFCMYDSNFRSFVRFGLFRSCVTFVYTNATLVQTRRSCDSDHHVKKKAQKKERTERTDRTQTEHRQHRDRTQTAQRQHRGSTETAQRQHTVRDSTVIEC